MIYLKFMIPFVTFYARCGLVRKSPHETHCDASYSEVARHEVSKVYSLHDKKRLPKFGLRIEPAATLVQLLEIARRVQRRILVPWGGIGKNRYLYCK